MTDKPDKDIGFYFKPNKISNQIKHTQKTTVLNVPPNIPPSSAPSSTMSSTWKDNFMKKRQQTTLSNVPSKLPSKLPSFNKALPRITPLIAGDDNKENDEQIDKHSDYLNECDTRHWKEPFVPDSTFPLLTDNTKKSRKLEFQIPEIKRITELKSSSINKYVDEIHHQSMPLNNKDDDTLEVLVKSCKKKMLEKESDYNNASTRIEELQRLLSDEKSRNTNYQDRIKSEEELISLGLNMSSYADTRMDSLNERFNTFKYALDSINLLVGSIPNATSEDKRHDELKDLYKEFLDDQKNKNMVFNQCKTRIEELQSLQQNKLKSHEEFQEEYTSIRGSFDIVKESFLSYTQSISNINSDLVLTEDMLMNVKLQTSHLREILDSLVEYMNSQSVIGEFVIKYSVENKNNWDHVVARYEIERLEWLMERRELIVEIDKLRDKQKRLTESMQALNNEMPDAESDHHDVERGRGTHDAQNRQSHMDEEDVFQHLSNASLGNVGPKRCPVTYTPRKRGLKAQVTLPDQMTNNPVADTMNTNPPRRKRRVRKLPVSNDAVNEIDDSDNDMRKRINRAIKVSLPSDVKEAHIRQKKKPS
ncbi:hypothetical protein BDB01DRAFT_832889 [Pilobolus umbonatus]|nr:hypothetical protein BDB01DRAFT_832889 [Pilobolus umbonatus]